MENQTSHKIAVIISLPDQTAVSCHYTFECKPMHQTSAGGQSNCPTVMDETRTKEVKQLA